MLSLAFDRLFRNPATGRVVIAQPPNVPLWLFIGATGARLAFRPAGSIAMAVSVVGALALGWWSVAEIGWGESLFRRLLGGVVLVGLVAGWVMRLA